MKCRRRQCLHLFLVLGVPVSVAWLLYKTSPLQKRTKQWPISSYVVSGKRNQKIQGWKGSPGTNHSTKPQTLCQPHSQPDTGPFTALTSAGWSARQGDKKTNHTAPPSPHQTWLEKKPDRWVWTGNRGPSAKWPNTLWWIRRWGYQEKCMCGLGTWHSRRVCQSVQSNFPLESWRRNLNTPTSYYHMKD